MVRVRKKRFFIDLMSILILLTSIGCDTSTLSMQATPNPTNTPDEITQDPSSIFVMTYGRDDDEDQVYRLDKDFHVIGSFPSSVGKLTLSISECDFYSVWGTSGLMIIQKIDFQGNILRKDEIEITENETANFRYLHTLSPTGDWIAFKEVSGDWGESPDSATIQNVKIINSNPTSTHIPIEVTTRGGAFIDRLSWSPNGKFLAYTDYDYARLLQIFVFDPNNKQKTQITNFTNQQEIQDIKWSLDSDILGASIFDQEEIESGYKLINGKVILINVNDQSVDSINLPKNDYLRLSFWWGSDQRLFLYTKTSEQESGVLNWYDTSTKAVETEKSISSLDMANWGNFVFPLTEDLNRIAIIGGTVFVYDITKGKSIDVTTPTLNYIFNEGFYQLIEDPSGALFTSNCN